MEIVKFLGATQKWIQIVKADYGYVVYKTS